MPCLPSCSYGTVCWVWNLECERSQFWPQVVANCPCAGEKIVEAPVRFEHRIARYSVPVRALCLASRRGTRSRIGTKARRREASLDRPAAGPGDFVEVAALGARPPIRTGYAVPPAVVAAGSRSRRPTRRPLPRSRRTSTIGSRKMQADRASTRRPGTPCRGGLPREDGGGLSTEGPRRLSLRAPTGAAFQPASRPPRPGRLVSSLVARGGSSTRSRCVSPASDETDERPDWKGRSLVDALLLLAILNLGARPSRDDGLGVLVLARFATGWCWHRSWRWHGPAPADSGSDKCNQAFAILAVLLACPLLPELVGVASIRAGGPRGAAPCSWGLPGFARRAFRNRIVVRRTRSACWRFSLRAVRLHRPTGGWPNCRILGQVATLSLRPLGKRRKDACPTRLSWPWRQSTLLLVVVFSYPFPRPTPSRLSRREPVAPVPLRGASSLERLLVVPVGRRGGDSGDGGGPARSRCGGPPRET